MADGNAGGDDGVDLSAEELDVLAGLGAGEPLTFSGWAGDTAIEGHRGFGDHPGAFFGLDHGEAADEVAGFFFK